MPRIHLSVAACAAALTCASVGRAALVIIDANIVANHYVYDLTFNDTATNAVLQSDTSSLTRLTCYVDNWNPTTLHEVMANYTNSSSAGLGFTFDFSQTGYRPVAMSLRETFTLFNNIHGHDLTRAWSRWSTDNSSWTTITDFSTPQTGYGGGTLTNYSTPIAGKPGVVYYSMSMTTQPGDGDGILTADHNQWNRIDSSNAGCYRVDFTLVEIPEPATMSLLLLGGVAMVCRRA
jgi:hypothetical protein